MSSSQGAFFLHRVTRVGYGMLYMTAYQKSFGNSSAKAISTEAGAATTSAALGMSSSPSQPMSPRHDQRPPRFSGMSPTPAASSLHHPEQRQPTSTIRRFSSAPR